MVASTLVAQYGQAAFNEVAQEMFLEGKELVNYGRNLPYWESFIERIKRRAKQHAEPRRSGQPSRSPNVRAPSGISVQASTSELDAFRRLQSVGTVRSLSVSLTEAGDYVLIVKVTLGGKQPVYRYGRVQEFSDIPRVLNHFIDKGYWTPDKQEIRKKRR